MLRLNQSYGHRKILLAYAGRGDHPVHAFLQHGWTLTPDAGSGRYANSRLFRTAPRLYWSERQAGEATAAGVPHAQAIGAPFLYLAKATGHTPFTQRCPTPVRRILVYPRHSAEFTARATSSEGVSRVADAVRSGYEVEVCLHPVDAQRADVVAAYESVGGTVVQHGSHLFDGQFLARQLRSLMEHDVVWSYGLGSAAMYAAALGVPVRFLDGTGNEDSMPSAETFGLRADVYEQLQESGSFPAFARSELGTDCTVSPTDLARLLGVHGVRAWQARGLRLLGRGQAIVRHRVFGDVTAGG